jgi:hypothetical protein
MASAMKKIIKEGPDLSILPVIIRRRDIIRDKRDVPRKI